MVLPSPAFFHADLPCLLPGPSSSPDHDPIRVPYNTPPMAPDLNSLPPSRSVSVTSPMVRQATIDAAGALRGQSPSPSLRSPTSLQAAAAVNASLQHEDSRRIPSLKTVPEPDSNFLRRSTVLMNLQLNDPALPSPGEMINEEQSAVYRTSGPLPITALGSGDSHHRTLSLGEIHQELEQEQEAQVNRLLQMIRTQQQHLHQLQSSSGQSHTTPPAIDESTPTSERSMSFSTSNIPPQHASAISTPRSPTTAALPRSSVDPAARADIQRRSRTPSQNASPRLRATSVSGEGNESWNLAGRDESAFYQAETQMMIRENQMLRQRIRELERQVNDLHANSAITHEPATSSRLLRSTSVSEEEPAPVTVTSSMDEPKE
ncbi:hypothetical protein B7494_g410 [Chlorociboria aeruginascens]|nr:hypothetical protein B7494_g410 [Chlorociboria aeruginascens]